MATDLQWLTRRPIAHRGYHDLNATRWENTLSAFRAAVARDFAIECDVQITADGEAVIFHDDDLRRLTGLDGKVRGRTAAELGRLQVGGTDDRIPTLAEALDLIAGKVPVIIELKGNPGHDERLVDAVKRDLEGYSGNAAIMSFAHWLVRQFPLKLPDIPGGLTAEGTGTAAIEGHFSMLANRISFVSFNVKQLPNPFVSFVRERLSMPVITYTVRDDEMVNVTRLEADQVTFEGFNPDEAGP